MYNYIICERYESVPRWFSTWFNDGQTGQYGIFVHLDKDMNKINVNKVNSAPALYYALQFDSEEDMIHFKLKYV
jgi:hypothetical protein